MSIKIPVPPDDMLDPRQPRKPARVWREFFEALGNAGDAVAVLQQGHIFVGNASNKPAGVAVSGDITLSSAGLVTLQATANTAEIAQDAVGGILANTGTVNLAYVDSPAAITATARYQMSIDADASGLKLLNDETSPGADQYYGTDSGGTKGWFTLAVGPTAGHWEPVSNMNPAAPELVFDGTTGDVVMGWVS